MALAVKVMGFDGNPLDQRSFEAGDRFIKVRVQLQIQAGNYAANGIALDWSNGGGAPANPSSIPPAAQGLAQGPCAVTISGSGPAGGVNANGGKYVAVPGTDPTNWLLKIFATAGTEYANGALGNDALNDIINAEVLWPR
ncbi:hypothetical protein KGP36_03335 [Patescibacteria group bacterium]|nr:hypothetical protein [Patescibacteria group bacterium]